jgi:hypothetical protein
MAFAVFGMEWLLMNAAAVLRVAVISVRDAVCVL